jgi:DNA-binding LytR/AlgR family response regulator
VADAMALITVKPPQFAFLDVDLGHEKCFGIAVRLRALGVPFAFATGYGNFYTFPAEFADVRIVAKPYTVETLRIALLPT